MPKIDFDSVTSLSSIIAELKDHADLFQVVKDMDLVNKLQLTKVGKTLQGNCPAGHPSKNQKCCSFNSETNLFKCFHCDEYGDIVGLVSLIEKASAKEATRRLATKYAPHLLEKLETFEENLPEEVRQQQKRATLYEHVYEHGKDLLIRPEGKVAFDYLTLVRGYDPQKLQDTEFIFWDFEGNIRAELLRQFPNRVDDIKALPLNGGLGDNFRVALPYRDRHGMILGYVKRHETAKGYLGIHRWDSTKGLKKVDLFGLNRVPKNSDTLVVVEGYPDAAYFPALGMINVVALGTAKFSEAFIPGLISRGIKHLILALDNDGVGNENNEKIADQMASGDLSLLIVPPEKFTPTKDPDEFVKANGIKAFEQLVANAESAPSWMANRVLAKHNTATDLGREKAIAEGLQYADSLSRPRDTDAVLRKLSSKLNLSDELLAEEYKKFQERRAAIQFTEGVTQVSNQVRKLVVEGKPEQALSALSGKVSELQADFWRAKEPHAEKLDDFLTAKQQLDATRTAGQRLGYELKDFAEIDRVISGLQSGLYIIGADPNIGKTAFMVSLMIDVLRSNTDARCLFYTMDDSREAIINRMLAHLTDLRINEVRFKLNDPQKEQQLKDAYLQITSWYRSLRLDIQESTAFLTMSRIQAELRSDPIRDSLVVFIDGLYNVPVDNDSGSIREENIERANQIKAIVKHFKIPVIATAEFRKQGREESSNRQRERTIHDIMETGKYGYNADLIILLSPKDYDNYTNQDEPIIVADFGKNKLESFRGKMEFKFIRAKSVMKFVAGSAVNP